MSTIGKNKRARLDSTESEVSPKPPQKSTSWLALHGLLESDFSCAICHEVLMNASVLGCGHCFCAYCIHMWLKRRAQCPLCTRPCHRFVPLKMVDSFIAQTYACLLPADLQSTRKQELEFREREQLLFDEASDETSDSELDSSTEESSSIDSANSSNDDISHHSSSGSQAT
ncbi:hypothetical protein FBUS_00244 [Fasciolopsis buskii]|uniref:RING-type domain-containing protein n=1 Tax=Fasciolopsis buskii TaxID=27845 RepID=A0A8E0VG41_9TREM|nr:hypothetical protein FBUS_00244 [Fasciolopsis buski]